MKISKTDLSKRLRHMWPGLADALPNPANIFLADTDYWLMSKVDIVSVVLSQFIDKYEQVLNGMDCDDKSLLLHAFVVQERYRKMKAEGQSAWLSYAFGQCWGTKLHGDDISHAVNIAVTPDSIMLIDGKRIWEANGEEDDPYFIRF